jgi:hypothetical protein
MNNNTSNKKNNTIINIINNNNKNNSNTNNISIKSSLNNNIEKYKSLMALFSIKDIIEGSIGTVIPWLILLFIIGFIIVV